MTVEIIYKMRRKLIENKEDTDYSDDYVKIINLARLLFIYVIQLLYDYSIDYVLTQVLS
jgi:hypothetical protein